MWNLLNFIFNTFNFSAVSLVVHNCRVGREEGSSQNHSTGDHTDSLVAQIFHTVIACTRSVVECLQ